MKKYVVICYSIHEKEIVSHDSFDNEGDAYLFLEKDSQNTYEEEINNASEEDKDSINFTISDDGTAYLSSYDGEYEWTWEVIEVQEIRISRQIGGDYGMCNVKEVRIIIIDVGV